MFVRISDALTAAASGSRWSATQPLAFSGDVVPNNPATKLWAAQQIDELGTRRGTDTAILRLSKRYTIPSKLTSWLAIPQEERESYMAEMAEAELNAAGLRVAQAFAEGRERSPEAHRLLANLKALSVKHGRQERDVLQESYDSLTQALASELASLMGV
jgi:hypothetical protein